MMISRGLGGNGGSLSITTERGGGGGRGRVLVTIFARERENKDPQGRRTVGHKPVIIVGTTGGRSRSTIGGGERGGGAR